jgi:hypothetical protein
MWEECQAAGDQMPVEGFNAYLASLDFEELPKLKVIIVLVISVEIVIIAFLIIIITFLLIIFLFINFFRMIAFAISYAFCVKMVLLLPNHCQYSLSLSLSLFLIVVIFPLSSAASS